MTPERWQQINQLFHSALEQERDRRAAFLAEACAGDQALRQEVESLIASHEQAESFIERPAADVAAELFASGQTRLGAGQKIGHYTITSLLGAGGMGEVYLAEDKKLDRQVAIKILHEKFSREESNLNRFIREAKAASALNHPNILVIHEIGETEEAHYIVSEFVKGQTLREMFKEKSLRLAEVLDVSIQIAGALCMAHEAGLVHRDIKPENVMIRPDGYVKILDFGLAKLVERKDRSLIRLDESTAKQNNTAKGMILGTANYMSPEQAKGERVDERTDIFSFGVLVYEMIAGRTPFAGDSMPETFANLINAEPQPLSRFAADVPEELERIVGKMLRKNKDERYQTTKEVLADLKAVRENLTRDEKLEKSHWPEEGNATAVLQATTGGGGAKLQTAETQNSFSQTIKRHKSIAAFVLAIPFIGVISLGGWLASGNRATSEATVLSAPFASEKLSTNRKVVHAVISPDGKNVVYTNNSSNEKQSVWLRHLETGNNVEIIPPSDNFYFGLAYAPDGDSLYFTRRPRHGEGQADIYRISIVGGIPQKIVGETQGWIGVSPDGARISFVRCYYRDDEYCSLWIADSADGRNEKKLVSRPRPFRIGDNEFSPDGKLIAFAAGQSWSGSNDFNLSAVDIENGAERDLTTEKFFDIKSLAWLPDQKALLLTASRTPNKNFRIWQVSASTGKAEPLTKDSESYSALSLDKTASRLVSTQVKHDFQLLVSDLENASNSLVLADATSVTFAPDGKIFYTSTMSGNDEIWSVNSDGGGQRQLTNDPADDRFPIIAPDNSTIYFASNRTGAIRAWRMNADGSLQTQVTHKTGGFPLLVSPDGEWLYYHHSIDNTLWRVSTSGGQEQIVLNKPKYHLALSPDGAFAAFSEKIGDENFIVIVRLVNAAQIIKSFKYADPQGRLLEIAWMPDAEGIVYILADKEYRHNVLWLQPFGLEKPRKIANLEDEQIGERNGFALAPDGKSFAVAQGGWLHDAVLLKGLQ